MRTGTGCSLMVSQTIAPKPPNLECSSTERIVTVEEHSQFGGLGAMVCETLSENPVPVRILGIPDENVVHGTNAEIFHHYGLDAEGVVKAVSSFLNEK